MLGSPSSYTTLKPIPSDFPSIWGNFYLGVNVGYDSYPTLTPLEPHFTSWLKLPYRSYSCSNTCELPSNYIVIASSIFHKRNLRETWDRRSWRWRREWGWSSSVSARGSYSGTGAPATCHHKHQLIISSYSGDIFNHPPPPCSAVK